MVDHPPADVSSATLPLSGYGRIARNPGPIPRSSRVGVKTSRSPPSVLMKRSRVRCSPLKAYLSIRNSPIRNDQAIEADLLRGELNSREAGTFRNAFELGESINVAARCSGQHHHAEGRRGGRRNAIRIGNWFSNCGAAAWV